MLIVRMILTFNTSLKRQKEKNANVEVDWLHFYSINPEDESLPALMCLLEWRRFAKRRARFVWFRPSKSGTNTPYIKLRNRILISNKHRNESTEIFHVQMKIAVADLIFSLVRFFPVIFIWYTFQCTHATGSGIIDPIFFSRCNIPWNTVKINVFRSNRNCLFLY